MVQKSENENRRRAHKNSKQKKKQFFFQLEYSLRTHKTHDAQGWEYGIIDSIMCDVFTVLKASVVKGICYALYLLRKCCNEIRYFHFTKLFFFAFALV